MTSIRSRLAILYTASVLVILIVIVAFLYWESINVLYKTDHQFLTDVVQNIRSTLTKEKIDDAALNKMVVNVPYETNNSVYRYYARVVDGYGNTIVETPSNRHIFQNKAITNLPNDDLVTTKFWHISDFECDYLQIKSPIKFGNINKIGYIQVILDVSHQHKIMRDRKIFLVCLLAAIALALMFGFYLSHKGIQSLYVLTETAKKISATSLSARIDPKDWPAELRVLGIAFNQMLERMESSFLRLKQISSDLAHELRTPINNLIGETEIALSNQRSVDEYQNVLVSNLEELHRTAQLIENILFLARAENPELHIDKAFLNMHDEVAMMCDYYQAMAEEKNITINYAGSATLFANSIMIRRMICNILSNSIKYTSAGGKINFLITQVNDKEIKVIAEDNGIGIANEHLPKIFDRFYRVDSARSQLSGGTGLGLALVKSIVEMHKGSIAIKSTLGVGTAVTIVLPVN